MLADQSQLLINTYWCIGVSAIGGCFCAFRLTAVLPKLEHYITWASYLLVRDILCVNKLLYLNAKAICHNWEKFGNYGISNLPFNYFQFLRYLVIFHIDHLCKYYLQGGAKYINQTYMKICIVSIYRDMQTTDYISRQDPYINTCA